MKQKASVRHVLIASSFLFALTPKLSGASSKSLPASCQVKAAHELLGAAKASVDQIIVEVKEQNARKLSLRFHKKLGDQRLFVQNILSKAGEVLGKPVETSLEASYLLQNAEGKKVVCPDLSFFPHYGFNEQYFLFFSLAGKKELGKLVISLVPSQNDWQIGYFHFRRTTHLGLSAQAWYEKAQELAEGPQKDEILAALAWQTASSLLVENPHFVYNDLEKIEADLSLQKVKASALARLQSTLKNQKLSDFTSLLIPGGPAILLKFVDPTLAFAKADAKTCQASKDLLEKEKMLLALKGLRCNFYEKALSEKEKKSDFLGL